MSKILMLIKTSGLEYDDRLRKECLSIQNKGGRPVILALEDENKKGYGKIYNHIPYQTIKLKSRDIFPHKKFISIKTFEMYTKFLLIILKQKPHTLWVHDMEMRGIIPLLFILKKMRLIKRIVWDQHELPNSKYLNKKILLSLYNFLNNLSDKIIVANEERKDFIIRKTNNNSNKIYVLNNFPDEKFTKIPLKKLPDSVIEWLNGKQFLLAQGGANPNRNLEYLIEAMMKEKKIKLIVVGPYNKCEINKNKKKYGSEFERRILFTGLVPQMDLTTYIDNCLASVIFYNNKNMNNKLCAPNRLYQAICRRKPVLVGSNPPMKNIVEDFKNGIVLETDGSDPHDISKGIRLLQKSYEKVKTNAENIHNHFSWESQNYLVEQILS